MASKIMVAVPGSCGSDEAVWSISDAPLLRTHDRPETPGGKLLWSVRAPKIRYRAGAFPMGDGKQVIAADFSKPGRMVIFDPSTGKASWEYFHADGEKMLDHRRLRVSCRILAACSLSTARRRISSGGKA
jgi:outer membrane protein assembly factor BamB